MNGSASNTHILQEETCNFLHGTSWLAQEEACVTPKLLAAPSSTEIVSISTIGVEEFQVILAVQHAK